MEFFAKACRWVKSQKTSKTVQVNRNGRYESYTYEIPERLEKIVQDVSVTVDMETSDWFNRRLTEIKPVSKPQFTYYSYPTSSTANTGWKGHTVDLFENSASSLDEEYDFEHELAVVCGIKKDIDLVSFLGNHKIDMTVLINNLGTYTAKEQDVFFDQLSEWIVQNDLQESKFYAQIDKFLKNVEPGIN